MPNKEADFEERVKKICFFLMLFYFLFLVVNGFFKSLDADTFYYWTWGQHLSFGYLDGPPLIAFIMRIFSDLLGNHLFTLNFVAVSLAAISTIFLVKLIHALTNNKAIAVVAAVLWLLSDSTSFGLLGKATYDSPEQLFWIASVYYALLYLKTNRDHYLYILGLCFGLLLLSKYTGGVLLFSMLLFLIGHKNSRSIFKNKHFYFSALLTLFLILPNLIWNYQHHWLTVTFQVHRHSWGNVSPFGRFKAYGYHFIKGYCIDLVLLGYLFFKHKFPVMRKELQQFFVTVFGISLLFWSITAFMEGVAYNYIDFFRIFSSTYIAYYLVKFKHQKIFFWFLIISIIYSVNFLTKFDRNENNRAQTNIVLKDAVKKYDTDLTPIIGGSTYQILAQLNFLAYGAVVTFSNLCKDDDVGQFAYWNQDFRNRLAQKNVPKALYISFSNNLKCVRPYFKSCVQLPSQTVPQVRHPQVVYVYECINP